MRLSAKARDRKVKIVAVREAMECGKSLSEACQLADISVQKFNRLDARKLKLGDAGLEDRPRSGRPSIATVSAEDAERLMRRYLETESQTKAARSLADEAALAPDLCAAIMKKRADPSILTTQIKKVFHKQALLFQVLRKYWRRISDT